MEYPGELVAERSLEEDCPESSSLDGPENTRIGIFDEARSLFVATGLPPEPGFYEIFYLHLTGADFALSRELLRALAGRQLGRDKMLALRKAHLGDIATAELQSLVEAAQSGATRLVARLAKGEEDLRQFDATVSESDRALQELPDAATLGRLIRDLQKASARMNLSNRRLEADLKSASHDQRWLIERLEAAERSARTDPLTGLPNRRGVTEALARAIAQSRDSGLALSVAFVDLDRFSRMNDRWGHNIGDEVLRCVAAHLADQARRVGGKHAFAGRFGGEEFVVSLPGIALGQACAAMDEARGLLARQVLRRADDGASLGQVSFSAGIALLHADDCVETLLDRADSALFAAKKAGRDRVLPETDSADLRSPPSMRPQGPSFPN